MCLPYSFRVLKTSLYSEKFWFSNYLWNLYLFCSRLPFRFFIMRRYWMNVRWNLLKSDLFLSHKSPRRTWRKSPGPPGATDCDFRWLPRSAVKFNIRGVRYRRFSLATKSVRRDRPIKSPNASSALKNKEPSKQKNYVPLVTLMEDDDSNCSREEIPLDNIVDDTADVLRGSPSRILIIVSAFFFFSFQESNTLPVEENLSREEVRSLTSSEVCQVCFVLQILIAQEHFS